MWKRAGGNPDDGPAKGQYERHKRKAAERQAKISAGDRDIGPIPEIASVRRRNRCRESLRLFCETYNPTPFSLAWSEDHLKVLTRIEEAAMTGAMFAFAMPRGSGKTTICRMAALWAISYAHCRYVFVIGANEPKAVQTLDAIKTFIRFLPTYAADFPEIAVPARRLGGLANRASGQLCQGQSTMIEWAKDRLVLPAVPHPPNFRPKPKSGLAPTSGSLIGISGLSAAAIRGSLATTTDGGQLRPDLVLLDDPQTDDSARSITQNQTREELVGGAVLGMAGPDKPLAAVMPCTVIRPGDFVDRILDRKLHPLWRGERTRMLRTMPANMEAWESYFQVYRECAQREPPDFSESNAYYLEHRDELDAGADAAWPDRFKQGEVSAIQRAMHEYCRSERAFFAEYQNEPLSVEHDQEFATADAIAAKVTGVAPELVPPKCSKLTAFIDVQGKLLYWGVVAWADGFGGQMIAYGSYPDQKRTYYTLRDARITLQHLHKKVGLEGATYAALMKLTDDLLGRDWYNVDRSATFRIERCLIDAGGEAKGVVYDVCRDSKHATVLTPSFGRGLRASDRPMTEWKRNPGEEVGHHWRRRTAKGEGVRYALIDTNTFKTLVHRRLAAGLGDPDSLALYKASPDRHRMLAEQLTAETPVRTEGQGRDLIEWRQHDKSRDNHFLDVLTGCAAAASMVGVAAQGHVQPKRRSGKRLKLSDLQRGGR